MSYKFSYLSAGTAGWSFWPTVAVNAAGGAYTSHLKGEDPLVGGFASSLGAGTGYWAGKFVEPLAKNLFNVNQNGIKYEFIDIGLTIQKNKPESIIPNYFGNAGGSISSELSTKFFEGELKEVDW